MTNQKKILVLGGTAFVGRVIVEHLLSAGIYDITLFNRGITNAELFPHLPRIIGNREQASDIAPIGAQDWDAVIDVSGYYPLSLQNIADLLRGRVGRYIFVSTASVYQFDENNSTPIDENYQLETCSDEEKTDRTMLTYGKRKVACEQVLLNSGIDTVILRPAVIYGKYDPFDRHYYWLYRAAQSDRILMPAETHSTNRHTSTYVKDFAKIVLAALEIPKHQTIYNATTHPIISLRELVTTMATVCDNNPKWIVAPLHFLESEKIQPWTDLPLWINGDFLTLDNTRLLNDLKIQCTPLAESLRQTAEYYASLQWQLPKTGLSLPDEDEVMTLLLQKKSS